jgi:hypothetical protein
VRVFAWVVAFDDANGSHACSLEEEEEDVEALACV